MIHRPAPPGARAWADPGVMAYLRERNVPTVVVEEPDHEPIPLVRPLYGSGVRQTIALIEADLLEKFPTLDVKAPKLAAVNEAFARALCGPDPTYNDGTCRTCFASTCVCRHLG